MNRELSNNFFTRQGSFINKLKVPEIVATFGALMTFFGLIYLVFLNWNDFSETTKIATSLSIGIVSYLVGILLFYFQRRDVNIVANALHVIAGTALPIGIFVLVFYLWGDNVLTGHITFREAVQIVFGHIAVVFAITSVLYGVSWYVFKNRGVFLTFALFSVFWLYISLLSLILGDAFSRDALVVMGVAISLAGIFYLAIGALMSTYKRQWFQWVLYLGGSSLFLFGAYLLDGSSAGYYVTNIGIDNFWIFNLNNNFESHYLAESAKIWWEIIYPVFLIIGVGLAFYLRSRIIALVVFSFCISYVEQMTRTFDKIQSGDAVYLIVYGLLAIGLAFMLVRITSSIRKHALKN